MSIKRRIGCLLCAGLLPGVCTAHADMDTAYTTRDASAVWQSNSGKMQINLMDAQMHHPADALYLTEVTPRLFTKEELLRVWRAFQPEAASISGEYEEPFKGYMELVEANDLLTLTASGSQDNGTLSEVRVTCSLNSSVYLTGYMQRLQRIHGGNAHHCRYTLAKARTMADTAAAAIAPDYAYSAWGFMELYPRDGSDTGHDDYDYIEGYSFCYTPVMAGIQVPYTPDENEDGTLTLLTCTPNDVLLTLNALDGTVIDRRYGY